jgi:tetratricopeptide (TPR) repeat protein
MLYSSITRTLVRPFVMACLLTAPLAAIAEDAGWVRRGSRPRRDSSTAESVPSKSPRFESKNDGGEQEPGLLPEGAGPLLITPGGASLGEPDASASDGDRLSGGSRPALAGSVVQASAIDASADQLAVDAFRLTKTAKSLEDYEAVLAICERALALDPTNQQREYVKQLMSWGHNRRGQEYSSLGDETAAEGKWEESLAWEKKALEDYETAIELDPKRWRAIHNRGVSRALLGEFDAALADFDQALELKPDYANAWFNRAEVHRETGKPREALNDYEQLLVLRPQDAAAYVGRGRCHAKLGNPIQAFADFSSALGLSPQFADGYVFRGEVNAQLGEWEKAAADLRTSIKLDKNSGRAWRAVAWFTSTCPDARFRDGELALIAAQRAIELDGAANPHYLDALAAAYANAGKFDNATEVLKKAIEQAPEALSPALSGRLALYEAARPYRQPEPAIQSVSHP